MLHHVVLVTLKEGVDGTQVDAALEGFASLPPLIPEIRTYDFGREAGISPNDFGVVMVASFDSKDDFTAYREHPAHKAFAADLLRPIAEKITTAQFFGPV